MAAFDSAYALCVHTAFVANTPPLLAMQEDGAPTADRCSSHATRAVFSGKVQ